MTSVSQQSTIPNISATITITPLSNFDMVWKEWVTFTTLEQQSQRNKVWGFRIAGPSQWPTAHTRQNQFYASPIQIGRAPCRERV